MVGRRSFTASGVSVRGGLGGFVWARWGWFAAVAVLLGAVPLPAGADSVPSSPYDDVAINNSHRDDIAKLKARGVFIGTECGQNHDQFCPDNPLDRGTFAVWMIRVLDGTDSPAFIDPAVGGGQSLFADVGDRMPEALFINRLAELEVTRGCSQEPKLYCPDQNVSRAQMASFLARAFGLPSAHDARFTDVVSGSTHHNDINRLYATKITTGCSKQPKLYCPQNATTRAQMASFLARAIVWQDSSNPDPEEPVPVPVELELNIAGIDDSIGLSLSFDKDLHTKTDTSWGPPSINSGQVDYYVVQWRYHWSEFGSDNYEVIPAKQGQTKYTHSIPNVWDAVERKGYEVYAVRVVAVYKDGKGLATNEIKVDSYNHQFRDLIKERIIDPNKEAQPWLADVWDYISKPTNTFNFVISSRARGTKVGGVTINPTGDVNIDQTHITKFSAKPIIVEYFDGYKNTIAHELGHVYTLTNGISDNPAPSAIGYLYLSLLITKHGPDAKNPRGCADEELYADLAELAFFEQYDIFNDTYFGSTLRTRGKARLASWAHCGLVLDQETDAAVLRDIPNITRSVFIDQEMPVWFYDTYQLANGTINLDKLWADIAYLKANGRSSTVNSILYDLKNEFGGYCLESDVRKFIDKEVIEINGSSPWRDDGCDYELVYETTTNTPGAETAPPIPTNPILNPEHN